MSSKVVSQVLSAAGLTAVRTRPDPVQCTRLSSLNTGAQCQIDGQSIVGWR